MRSGRHSTLLRSNPLIDRAPVKPSDPIASKAAVARSEGQGRPRVSRDNHVVLALTNAGNGSGRRSLALDGSEHGGRLTAYWSGGPCAPPFVVPALLSACLFTVLTLSSVSGEPALPSQPATNGNAAVSSDPWAAHIVEASKRFAIPESWIRAVIQVESTNDKAAVSPKGAMGLMQIMPKTWHELRIRYRLGDDPFLPRDNVLAGTAYLREMLDRFGRRGFLAAYNAGPARYQQHLATGRPLPTETIDYVRKLMPFIDGPPPIRSGSHQSADQSATSRSSIFVQSYRSRNADREQFGRTADRLFKTGFPAAGTPDISSSQSSAVTDLTAIEPMLNRPSDDAGVMADTGRDGLFPPR
jgi:hypothetical protein